MDRSLWHCTGDRDQDHPQEKVPFTWASKRLKILRFICFLSYLGEETFVCDKALCSGRINYLWFHWFCEWSLKFKYWRVEKEAKVRVLFHFLIICNCLLIILKCGQISWGERNKGENLHGLRGEEGLWGRYIHCPDAAPPCKECLVPDLHSNCLC